MTTSGGGLEFESFVAAGDLSTKKHYFMKLSADRTVTTCAAVTDKPIGVLYNKPAAAGRAAQIAVEGRVEIVAGGTVAAGDKVGTHSDGTVVAYVPGTDTTKYIVGMCVVGAASGEIAVCDIDCAAAGRGA